MPTSWRVMLNHKRWDQRKYEEDFMNKPEVRRLAQSKGSGHMVRCPQKGDIVFFVCKGKIVMKGVCDSDGFESGIYHQVHSCNIGDSRPHALHQEFVWVKITEIGLFDVIRPTGQRTWARMPL